MFTQFKNIPARTLAIKQISMSQSVWNPNIETISTQEYNLPSNTFFFKKKMMLFIVNKSSSKKKRGTKEPHEWVLSVV